MPNNESSELQLGTEVEIIGPSRGGDSRHTGEKFEISQIDISKSRGEFYSHEGFSWYPASSLRVVQKFKKGDRVYCEHGESVICPGNWIDKKTGTVNDPDYITGDGIKCVIVDWDDKSKRTSVLSSNLRLMEDGLKIGDWVEVIGPAVDGPGKIGAIFKILDTFDSHTWGRWFSSNGMHCYPAESLRKLTPEEMQPIKVIPTAEDNAKRLDAHREEMDAANERLSAIEQRQSAICSYNIETEQRLQKLEAVQKLLSQLEIRQDSHSKRLADVEYILSEIEKRLELIR